MIERSSGAGKCTIIPNAILGDERLTFEARGMLCYVLSMPDGALVETSDLLGEREADIMGQLVEAGYAEGNMKDGYDISI